MAVRSPQAPVLPERIAAEPPWVPILMYHRVVPRPVEPDPYHLYISTADFEAQIRFLSESGYRSVALDSWADSVVSGRQDVRKQVIITLDDGYADVLEHAWPVLEKYGFGATAFVVSGRIGDSNVWDRGRASEARLLGLRELRELGRRGLSFGCHGRTHRALPDLSPEAVREEIVGSKAVLEDLLDVPVRTFCFPYGRSTPALRAQVQLAGYRAACGIEQRDHALFNLSRVDAATCRGADLLWRTKVLGLHHRMRRNRMVRRMWSLARRNRSPAERSVLDPAAAVPGVARAAGD